MSVDEIEREGEKERERKREREMYLTFEKEGRKDK